MPASITLTVSHLPTSTSFFLSTLQPLNYVYRGRVNDTIGFGHPDAAPDFWITQSIPDVPPGPAHVAFPATSRGKVHDFFHAALKAGGKVHGEPALRDDCGYYSAAIIDFDGNSIEAVFRPDLLEENNPAAAADDAKSVASMTKSVAKSKAPTVVSSASKAKSMAPSKAGSVAPSAAARTTVSKAPSAAPSAAPSKAASAAPSRVVSVAPSQAARSVAPSVAPSAAPKSTVSRAPTAAASEAPARTTISRAPTAPAAPSGSGNSFADMMAEARGTVSFAREMVNSVRSNASPPPAGGSQAGTGTSPDSHGPSDAIVGTLLGVAAGAALHYAFSNRKGSNQAASAPVTPPDNYARSETVPSFSDERYHYYYNNNQEPQYAIEPAGSEYSRASGTRHTAQRLIEMVDNDPSMSDILGGQARSTASTARPRRRSSFSGVSAARTTVTAAKSGVKMLEGPPPSSYRGPTVVTSISSHHGGSVAAASSTHSRRTRRSSSASRASTARPTPDEGYASATDDRASKHSHHSHHSHSRSKAPSTASTARPTPSRANSSATKSVVTAVHSPPAAAPAPAPSSTAGKKVIGRLTEKQLAKLEAGGRFDKGNTDVTKSVISKVKATERLDVRQAELGPEDSVSQVSSVRSGASRRRS